MDASTLTIDSLFAGPTSAHLVSAKSQTSSNNTRQITQKTFNSTAHTNINEKKPDITEKTSDKTYVNAQNKANENTSQHSKPTDAQKPNNEKPQKSGISNQPAKQNPTPNVALHLNIAQQCLAQHPQNIEQSKAGTAEIAGKKTGDKSAPFLKGLNTDKLAPTTGQTLKPFENKTLPVDKTSMIGPKTFPPNTAKQPVTVDIQPGKVENAGDIQPGKVENAGDIQPDKTENAGIIKASNKTLFITKDNTSQQGSEGLNQKAVIDINSQITAQAGKTAFVHTEGASDGQKTSTLIIDSLPVQNNTLQSQVKSALSPEISPSVTEKPAADEPAFIQQTNTNAQGHSEFFYSGSKNQKQNSSGNPAILKANITEPSNEQGKNQHVKTDNISNSIFERPISSNNIQTNTTSESLKFTGTVNNSNDTLPKDTVDGIGRQISESIQNSLHQQTGKQQITVHLNPPELGKVCIKFQEQQNQLTGSLEVNRTQTKHEIEQSLPQIIRNLGDSGIQVKRLDVILTDQAGQQFAKGQSTQNGSFQQHYFAGNDAHQNQDKFGTNEWFSNNNSYEDDFEAQAQFTENSINMLV